MGGVDFRNVTWDNNYIYGEAKVWEEDTWYSVKVHRVKEEFYINPNGYNSKIIKALWTIARRLREKKKLNTEEYVVWG